MGWSDKAVVHSVRVDYIAQRAACTRFQCLPQCLPPFLPSRVACVHDAVVQTDLGLQLLGVVLQALGPEADGLVHLSGPVDHVHTQHHLSWPLLDPLHTGVLCICLGAGNEAVDKSTVPWQ